MISLPLIAAVVLLGVGIFFFSKGRGLQGGVSALAAVLCVAVWFVMRPSETPEFEPREAIEQEILQGELAPRDPAAIEPSKRPGRRVFGGQGSPAEPLVESSLRQDEELGITPKRTNFRLFGDARVRPAYEGRTLLGVSVEAIAPGSFWHELGVRDGEIVYEWNGRAIVSPADTVALLNDLQTNPEIELKVRDYRGNERTLRHREPNS